MWELLRCARCENVELEEKNRDVFLVIVHTAIILCTGYFVIISVYIISVMFYCYAVLVHFI